MTLAAGQRVVIFAHFTHTTTGDIDLHFFGTDGQSELANSVSVTDNEAISYTVPITGAGTYYLQVLGFDASMNSYDLSVSGGCYAQATSTFGSTDAQAVRDAVAQASPGSTVKVAGYCPGAVAEAGTIQTVQFSKTLTLAGGYAPANWTAAHPITQPTTLDAMNGGRVISATGNLTITGLTVQKGSAQAGGGLFMKGRLVLSGTTLYSNTAEYSGGGVYIVTGRPAILTDTNFVENVALNLVGGGMSSLDVIITRGRFERNQAATNGGGLNLYNKLVVTGTTFVSNSAGVAGGGAFYSGIRSSLIRQRRAL